MHAAEFLLPSIRKFGLLAVQSPLGAGDVHDLAGAHADEIGFKLREGGDDIEEHLSHGIVRVVEHRAQGQFHAAFPKLVGGGAGVRDGLGQAVEFEEAQGVAFSNGGDGRVGRGWYR